MRCLVGTFVGPSQRAHGYASLLTLDVGKQLDDLFDYFSCAWS